MTTAKKSLDRARWEARAISLAEEGHLIHRASYAGTGCHGESLWRVSSKRTDGTYYIVHVWPAIMTATCTCTASMYSKPCAHCGAALLAEGQKQAAEHGSEGDTAPRWFAHGGEW
jgi:hypothetical protein